MKITVRSTSRNLAARAAFVAVLSLCALPFAAPGSASAATYSVYSCLGPNSEPLPNSSWLTSVNDPSQTLYFSFGSNCGDLSVAASSAQPYVNGNGAEYVFDAPAGTTISAYSLNRQVVATFPVESPPPSFVTAGLSETDASETLDFDCVNVSSVCGGELPQAVSRSGLALSKVSIGVRCADGAGCPADSFTQLSTRLMDARVDLDDSTDPVIASVGGSLPGSNSVSSAKTIDVTATDVGGGVRMISLWIDGTLNQTSVAGGSCGQPYTLRAPCPSGLVRTLNLNTATLLDGTHTATLTATDAAGNLSSPYSFTFGVSSGGFAGGGGTPPTNGSPAVEQPTVKAERSVISSANGRAVVVEGTLTTAAGAPVSGAVLDVNSLDLGVYNAQAKSIGTTTTTSAGRFSIRVKPNGAQRISVLFRPFPASIGTAVASTIVREDLKLSVKRSKSRVKPGGALTLSGKLDGAGAAADDTPVEIDAKIGKTWRAVGVVESNSRGNYKWNYRFTRVKQPTRFTFRAIVRKNKSWPWPTETAKSVTVLVAR